jgi:molecular chaperone DnaK
MAKDNVSLGKFDLDGIPPAPRGVPQIKVSFSIDANGILNVKAEDLGTKKAQHITITAKNKLNKDEIEKFVREAEKFSEEDKRQRSKIEAKNEADTVLYATEKALREHGGKVSQEERGKIDRALSELKDALKTEDPEKINKAKDELIRTSQKLGEAIYSEAAAKAQSPGKAGNGAESPEEGKGKGAAEKKGKDDVVDAEVVDEEEKK